MRHSMSRARRAAPLVALLLVASASVLLGTAGSRRRPATTDVDRPAPAHGSARSSIAFERNMGQTDPDVRFLARGKGSTAFVTGDETVFVLPKRDRAVDGAASHDDVLRMRFAGAKPNRETVGEGLKPSTTSYFTGRDATKWRQNVPTYDSVRMVDVYEGVDVRYHGDASGALEYDFVVRPAADAAPIALAFDGAHTLRIGSTGDLRVRTGDADVIMKAPVAYQDTPDGRVAVASHYELDGTSVHLRVGAYDPSLELVVDPLIGFSSYLGGSGVERVTCLARDTAGNLYVSGSTTSPNFPKRGELPGQGSLKGPKDVFVTKLNPSASQILYSTYLGGSAEEYMTDGFVVFETGAMRTCAVDAQGRLYVSSTTTSPDFPVTPGAFQTDARSLDVTVSRLSATGGLLEASTFLGGMGSEYWASIAIDGTGHVWATGHTTSIDFPLKAATQLVRGNPALDDADVFVTRLNPDLTNTTFSTFLGGRNPEYPFDIAIDSQNSAYIVGATASDPGPNGLGGFPVTPGAFQTAYGGSAPGLLPTGDAFLTKFQLGAGGAATIAFSTFIGGPGFEIGQSVALGTDGSIYVGGTTQSDAFPGQSTRPSPGGADWDGFLIKLNAAGTTRQYTRLFGQPGTNDGVYDIAVNAAGNAFLAGTGSLGNTTVNGCGRPGDRGILGMLNVAGSAWEYLTPFGQANTQILVDGQDAAYVAGWGGPGQVPIVGSAAQATYGGGESDAYVLKLAKLPNASLPNCAPCTGDAGSTGAGPCPAEAPLCSTSGECVPTGSCAQDPDCGGPVSGRVCDARTCKNGCRGRNGNGCAPGFRCTSTTETVGQCVVDSVDAAAPDAAVVDAGPRPDAGPPPAGADAGLPDRNDDGTLEGGGLSCSAHSSRAPAGALAPALGLFAAALLRRRSKRA